MKVQMITFLTIIMFTVSCSKSGEFGTLVTNNAENLATPGQEGPTGVVTGEPPVVPPVNPPGPNPPTLKDQTDSFMQSSSSTTKVDILWNIDSSGSMQGEQNAIAQNFDIFINDFLAKGVDFKMAVTTTDPKAGNDGNIHMNSDQVLTRAAAMNDENMFIDDFQTIINVGVRGSGDEQGLRTTRNFYQKNGANFMRPDALQVVVIVSDEEDHSQPGLCTNNCQSVQALQGLTPVDQLVNEIKQASSSNVKIYSIVDTMTSNPVYRGSRYQSASQQTGGVVADINASFYQSLQDFGQSIVNLTESFILKKQPASVDSISVFVNGVKQSAGSYVYSAQTNSIKFNPGSLPSANSQIVVTYKVL